MSQIVPGIAVNEARHSSQMGTRLARTSNVSQIRQLAGRNTLLSASPAADNQPAALLRNGSASRTGIPECRAYSGLAVYGSRTLVSFLYKEGTGRLFVTAALAPFFPGR